MATSYGSITIVDITDVGQFSVVPMSNAGLLMIYDPNALNNKYTPASITLSPVAYYGGDEVSSSATYTWYKRTGGAIFDINNPGTATATTTTVSISSSDFSTTKNITYYVKAVYAVSGIGNLTAYGQISISLVQQASNIQDIEISGDHIFKYVYNSYGANPTIEGNTSVTLTASCTNNVAVHQWYYYTGNSSSPWSVLTTAIAKGSGNTGSVSGSTCIIDHTANIFINNKARIKVTAHRTDATSTELATVYDEYTILKLYDGQVGAPGDQSVAILLTNEDQMIPCDKDGVPYPNDSVAFSLASTEITVLEGNTNITTDNISTGYRVTATANGVTSTNGLVYDSTHAKYTYKVDGWGSGNASNVGYVEFTAQRTGYPTLTKRMSLTKIQTGQNGLTPIFYNLSITPNRVTTNENGATTENVTLTASVISIQGPTSTDVTTSSTDVIYYQWFKDNSQTPSKYGVATGSNTNNTYTISSGTSVSSVVCKIRKTNQSGDLLDSQSVAFIAVGAKGDTGSTGDGAISLDFPQHTDTIGLDSDGKLTTQYQKVLPYTVYQGSTALSAQASSGTGYSFSINGVTPTMTWGTTSVTVTIPSGTQLYDASANPAHSLNGQCTIPISYTATQTSSSGSSSSVNGSVLATFSWNLDIAPVNGSSVSIDTNNSWVRYKRTANSTQPTIAKTDATSFAVAESGGTKPYYIWCLNRTTYSDGNVSNAYNVTYCPADPANGKSVQTSSTVSYAYSTNGTTTPSSGWQSTIAAAVNGKSKPYYVWTRNVTSYTYDGGGSAGSDTTTYSTSYYPQDKVELNLTANSTIFNGNVDTITITPVVTINGSNHTIAGTNTDKVVWYYTVNGTMTAVPTNNTSSDNIYINGNNLIVKKDAVNGSASIQCVLTTSGQNVYKYLSLEDYTDEFRCELWSTIGDKLTNSQGNGFVYCQLYRNGQQIHKLTTNPSVTTAREASGASPHAAVIAYTTESLPSDISSITYSWSYQKINASGGLDPINDSTYNGSGKVIYIDGSMIDQKIVISCVVTINYV